MVMVPENAGTRTVPVVAMCAAARILRYPDGESATSRRIHQRPNKPVDRSIYLSTIHSLSLSLSLYLSIYLSLYLSIYLPVNSDR